MAYEPLHDIAADRGGRLAAGEESPLPQADNSSVSVRQKLAKSARSMMEALFSLFLLFVPPVPAALRWGHCKTL